MPAAETFRVTLIGSKLYGLTNAGGDNDEGTVFSINTDGSDFAVLHSFGTFDSGEAVEPIGGNGLTLVGSTLYGVSFNGGAAQNGAIFSLNPDGSNFQMLHSFDGSDGSGPYGSLALSGSQLYGTTSGFGVTVSSGTGTVFGMSLDGSAFTLLQTFAGGPNDGLLGLGTPAVSPDGSLLYGLTQYGGTAENGTIFSMTASGSLTNANLFNLAPSAGVLDTAFNSSNTRYTVYVVEGVSAITITPTPADAGATITVNGSPVAAGAPSTPINLTTGANVIDTIVTARDGVTTNLYTLTVIRLTPLQTWRWNLLGTPTDVGNAANRADFNGNGIPNLVKYAFGLDPTSPAANQVPQPILNAGNLGLNFNPPAGLSDIVYGAEWTPSLNPPNWTPLPDTGSGSMHSFQAFVGNLPSAFMRVKITVSLSPIEQLGKDIFFDSSLSNPTGLSCAGCHSPSAGFTGPNSAINFSAGPVPGAVAGRSGFRKPQAVAYSTFSPSGPYFDNGQQLWSGGNFWDGHAPTNAAQAAFPFIGPNEMANNPVGPLPPVHGGYSTDVAHALNQASYAPLFQQVFGANVFQTGNEANVDALAGQAIAAYEASEEVNPFTSKYDASANARPPANLYPFTASEENGRQLFFGKAQCFACHSSAPLDSVSSVTAGREVFTMYCYANIGTPRNPNNPFYQETDPTNNPNGYNPQGTAFIDYGLGSNPNPSPGGVHFMTNTPGDIADFRGLFKAPSLRNVDKRPSADFVKSYMHNGVFKSLEEVVHFYNKRNIAVNTAGEEVAFDLRVGPPAGYTPLFPAPEVLDNVQNVAGLTPSESRQGEADVATNGQIGHLELTPDEETDLVHFLETLTDGFIGSGPEQ
ncbi:choice-of-anchor tandem repeat GloVer-containing protein [Chthoniobacter flavus]|nr:choice-of-anchor tandem repeat GloVer-containing protein [Chthoniobacter flavus]